MKRILNILASIIILALAVSCKKAPNVEVGIVGEWQLTEMTGYEASAIPAVYIEFTAEKNFDIYQKVGDVSRFRKYSGTYAVAGTIVTGEYNDGEVWGSAYRVSLEADGEVLVMTAVTLDAAGAVASEGEVTKYVKASLAQEDKDAADIMTKSVESAVYFL
jgi:hypothetical protein